MEQFESTSSAIARVGYEPSGRVLEVVFRGGGTYRYFGVEARRYDALCAAESQGRYLNREIKPRYAFERVR